MSPSDDDFEPRLQADPGDRPPRKRARATGEAAGQKGGGKPPRRPVAKSWRRRLLAITVSLAIWIMVMIGAVVGWYATGLPSLDSLAATTRRPSVTLVSADGQTIATIGDFYGQAIDLKQVPPWLPEAVISTEDRRFYHHFGVDPVGILRAVWVDFFTHRATEGGSTITQQLAKNLFLTPERSARRKIQEALLALRLEHAFTKDQILALYLNRVYLGNGIFGVDAASRHYFGVPASRISLYQSALLAGLLKAPSRYNPEASPTLSLGRTTQVLENMVATKAITPAEEQEALRTGPASVKPSTHSGRYFADWVMQILPQFASARSDLVVHTTLDLRLETKIEGELNATLAGPGVKAAASQGAVVLMSPDGAVRALVGGRDYGSSQFDRATQALRQPGSSFKAFLYLTAMEQGWTPDSQIDDSPITSGSYRPQDFERDYEGPITLRHAFAKSSNVAAVRLIEQVGPRKVIATARGLGISAALSDDASLALGTSGVSPLEMTAAYASFANGGDAVFAYGINEVDDNAGHALYRRQPGGTVPVMYPSPLAEMQDLMSAVITSGTGKSAALDRPAAGKTGTTQDSRDAWFLGFTADYVAGVWLGNDDNSPMKKVTGGTLPAQLWHQVMMTANAGMPVRPLRLPAGVATASNETSIAAPVSSTQRATNPIDAVWKGIAKLFGG